MMYEHWYEHTYCYVRTLRSSGSDSDMELVKHIKENYIHRVHQAVQVSNALNVMHYSFHCGICYNIC